MISLTITLAACSNTGTQRGPADAPPLLPPPQQILRDPKLPERTPSAEVAEQDSAAAPADLWEHIREGLQLQALVEHERVSDNLDQYLDRRAALLQLERARFYLPFIVAEVQARGLPQELALLPFIESALDPYAFSHGGAAGLWQLMPATARHFGIEMNWWFDGRRDVVDSTTAALDYLEHLYAQFDDWLLALAAYNAGQGRIRRALQSAGDGATYWDLSVPAETAQFVPRLLALSALVAAPEEFGIDLPPLEPDLPFVIAELNSQIDLTQIAEIAEMPLDEVFMLNPGLNHGATPPGVPHRILVPAAYIEQFEAAVSVSEQAEQAARWNEYHVQRGDTLITIANRFGTSVAEIRAANDVNGHLIRQGQRLLIPHSSTPGQVPANPLLQTSSTTSTARYRVRAGDSLWSISRRFNTTVSRLVTLNRLDPRTPLRVGQQLLIPTSAQASPTDRALRRVHYRVKAGDSLYAIASRFNVSVRQIVAWNQLDESAHLHPGQRLVLMVDIRSAWS
jgi:membrane-bound lytic murein transglycosylase D